MLQLSKPLPMLRFLKRTLLLIAALLLIAVITIGIIAYRAINYPTYSLLVEAERFPDVNSEEKIAKLAEELVADAATQAA